MLNKISKKIVVLIILFVFIISMTGIAYATNYFWSGTTYSVYNGKSHAYLSSMSTAYQNIYSSAAANWIGITSKINGYFHDYTNNHPNFDEYYVTTTSTSGLLGYTNPRKKNLLGIDVTASVSDNWEYCKVYIYSNQMDAYKMTTAQKISNATHELGHSFKLSHPTTTQTSVMKQGIQSIGPTTYDENQLKAKWGN